MDDLIQEAEVRLCQAQEHLTETWKLLRQVDPALFRRAKLAEADVARLRLEVADRAGVAA